MLDKFINFFVHNVVAIIEIGFLVVTSMTIFIVYRSFKQERDTLDMSVDQMKGLEEILKRHLGNLPAPTGNITASVSAEGASADMQGLIREKETMIKSLTDKIGQLEKATQGATGIDLKEWEKKIADLKDRLAEYEIIEDDIANLTFYKSENTRLKEELGKLGGAVPASAPAAAPTPAPTIIQAPPVPEPAAVSAASSVQDDLEALMASAANVQKAATDPSAQNVISFPAPIPAAPPKNIMSEFEDAVKQKNALEQATSKTKKGSKLAVDEDDDAHSKKIEFPSEPKGDIIAEFSAAVGEAPAAAAPAPASEPAVAPGFQANNVNSEKLLDEINQMATEPAPASDGEGGGDDSKKLISEFEAFVKGNQ